MREGMPSYKQHLGVLPFLLVSFQHFTSCAAVPSSSRLPRSNPLNIYLDPAPPPEEGPPGSFNAIRDPAYLPAQIGGIVGSYALSLVLVALLLLCLHKRRRDFINAPEITEEEKYLAYAQHQQFVTEEEYQLAQQQQQQQELQFAEPLGSPYKNYSLPSGLPLSPTRSQQPLSPAKSQASIGGWTIPSPTSTVLASGADLSVDQTVVRQDRAMAQSQLEDMYKYVMEQEEAKQQGRVYEPPPSLAASPRNNSSMPSSPMAPPPSALRKSKPAGLDLNRDSKSESRGNSFLSFLRSPRKDKHREMSISSPIITPMSGTFPGHIRDQEMSPMPRRDYGRLPPPPVPSDLPFRASGANTLPTPELSPVSPGGMGIDERIDAAIGRPSTRDSRNSRRTTRGGEDKDPHSREVSDATTGGNSDTEPVSAVSEKSTTGLVGLPTSPKPGVNRFPSLDSLPASPRISTFSRSSKPTAIRAGGALPLRAFGPSIVSPTGTSHPTTKQTVFTRAENPLSPGLPTGMRTPWTGAPVPYTPYQPFSPVIPMTPSLMSKADRKRMRRLEPKTPTVEMVRETEDLW